MAKFKVAAIEKAIGSNYIKLFKGDGYWYFVIDYPYCDIYDTLSVYVNRLNDLSFDRWVEEGKDFIGDKGLQDVD